MNMSGWTLSNENLPIFEILSPHPEWNNLNLLFTNSHIYFAFHKHSYSPVAMKFYIQNNYADNPRGGSKATR